MKKSGFWSRFPQFMNWIVYELLKQQPGVVHTYEPLHLHIFYPPDEMTPQTMWMGQTPPPGHGKFLPAKPLDADTFQFVLKQMPTLRTLEFSGWGEPLRHHGIIDRVNEAWLFNKTESTIHTHGRFSTDIYRGLLTSHLKKLVINTVAHKPSAYAAITGQSASRFVDMERSLQQFLLVRSHYPDSGVFIELSMTVDVTTLHQVPEMIRYAESLGVDGVRFENYIGDPADPTLRTLYREYAKARHFIDTLKEKDYSIQVTMPVLLDQDMSRHRNCGDPHTTVSLNGDLQVSPCSRHLIFSELINNIWDKDFWNSAPYQWLRVLHGSSMEPVPRFCQRCPMNVAESSRVLNDRGESADPDEDAPESGNTQNMSARRTAMW